jgi:hypothetical protein
LEIIHIQNISVEAGKIKELLSKSASKTIVLETTSGKLTWKNYISFENSPGKTTFSPKTPLEKLHFQRNSSIKRLQAYEVTSSGFETDELHSEGKS